MIEVVASSGPHAALTAAPRPATRDPGLLLADRACLPLAMLRDCAVYTADRVWAGLEIGVEVELIR
jgi:PIN domain nuclease of toxin-antitoxin system